MKNTIIGTILKRIGPVIIVIIISLLVLFLYDFYILFTTQTKNFDREHIISSTENSANLIKQKIQSDLNTVYSISKMMEHFDDINSVEAKLYLNKISKELPFSSIVINDFDGNYYTASGGEIDLSNPEYFTGSLASTKRVSAIYKNALYDRDMVALTSPIYKDGYIIAEISGLYYTNYIHNTLSSSINNEKNKNQLIQKNGDYIMHSGPVALENYDNLYDFLSKVDLENSFDMTFITEAIKNNQSGITSYRYNGSLSYICYAPIGINDWYLVSSAPNYNANLISFSIVNPTISLSIRIILLFSALITYIIIRHLRYRREMESKNFELEELNERLERKNESLKIKAEIDQLTGLYNKITTENMINLYLKKQGRKSRSALFVIDIDNFKYFNDDLGHLTGDRILTEVSKSINKNFRSTDIKGRVGGDEFIILFKDVISDESIKEKALELKELLRSITIGQPSEEFVSCSIGISSYPENGSNYKELFHKADIAMYHAKKVGKDGFCLYNEENMKST